QADSMEVLELFANSIILVMLPWSTLNLVDFYFVRHGTYRTEYIFVKNGVYRKYHWIRIGDLVITVVVKLLFMSKEVFTGVIAGMVGGADFSWLVGLFVPFVLYYFPMKKRERKRASSFKKAE